MVFVNISRLLLVQLVACGFSKFITCEKRFSNFRCCRVVTRYAVSGIKGVESGTRLHHVLICGIWEQHLSRFWNQGSEVWELNGISDPVFEPTMTCIPPRGEEVTSRGGGLS